MAELPATASQAEFARIARVKRSYVTELKKAGRLVLAEDGKSVNVADSLARIAATRDPSKTAVAARHAAQRDDAEGQGSGAEPEEAATAGYAYWRERSEKAKALAAERDNLVADGKLLDAERVEAAVAQAGATVRSALEALPYDLAPELAPITDEGQIRARLVEAIEAALSELSRQFGAIARAATA